MSVDIKNTEEEPDIVPTPDFIGYRKDPSTAPGIDLLNKSQICDKAAVKNSMIIMNSKDAKVPSGL